jgi:hypothetical protein
MSILLTLEPSALTVVLAILIIGSNLFALKSPVFMQPNNQQQAQPLPSMGPYFEESLKLFENFDRSIRATAQTGAKQCESMMRDYGNFSLLALGGAVTFLTIAPSNIKTISLFFTAVVLLVSCLILTLLVRRAWDRHVLALSSILDARQVAITAAYGNYHINPTDQNQGAFTAITNQQVQLPGVPTWASRGQDAAGILFIAGILALAASLVFKISL